MTDDLLSDILRLMQVRGGVFGRMNAGGRWATPLFSSDTVKFCAATHGEAWYALGDSAPVRFQAGDVLLVNSALPLVMAGDAAWIANAADSCPEPDEHGHFQYGAGCDFSMVAGGLHIDADHEALLRRSLPPLIHVRGDVAEAEPLGWIVRQLVEEMAPNEQPGRTTTISALAQLLFVQTLRAYMAHASADEAGWLKVFGDSRLTAALEAMHGDPARPWRLGELARHAGLSRTGFAVKFHAVMGVPPLTYLMQWRMRLAQNALRSGRSVAQAAAQVGYQSESAFAAAFKRATGVAPGIWKAAVGNR
ncbi:helix-turn-helix domain-containing protein [Novosphingobium sp. FSY-8]|uniref:Helix-turn-helix domain-containing protein n=1 Tax=Novosphingobium ovatum TaxID=1908523 RepID=A0ABW9XA98_9SPHN|nr:AraC family transcriptional regulator [Novosphingobium ovatum]NBC35455.1 helix-turn-helix domain-containing protein [Novosphingobium ovatum]